MTAASEAPAAEGPLPRSRWTPYAWYALLVMGLSAFDLSLVLVVLSSGAARTHALAGLGTGALLSLAAFAGFRRGATGAGGGG